MSFFFDVVAIFAVGAAMQFIPAKAAPIHAGDLILPHQGQIQQDSVPDSVPDSVSDSVSENGSLVSSTV